MKPTENSGVTDANFPAWILCGCLGSYACVAMKLLSKPPPKSQKDILTLSLITFKYPQKEPLYIYSCLKDLFILISTTLPSSFI